MRALVPRLLVAVAAGVALLPIWGGCEAQRAYLELGEEIRSQAGDSVAFSATFDRGWLSSHAETRIGAGARAGRGRGGASTGGEPFELVLDHRVLHGPIAFAELLEGRLPRRLVRAVIDTTWTPDHPALSALRDALGDRPLIRARTHLFLDGSSRSEIESPPLESGEGAVRWAGVTGSIVGESAFQAEGFVEAGKLELRTDGGLFRVLGVAAQFEGAEWTQTLPRGELHFGIEEISLSGGKGGGGETGFALHGLRFSEVGGDDVVSGKYELVLGAGFERLEVGGERYGPGELEIVLRNLDVAALERFRATTAAVPSGDAAEEREAAVVEAARAALPALLASSPELELRVLRLDGPAGRLAASGRLGFDDVDPALLTSPLVAALALRAEAQLFVPGALLERVVTGVLDARTAEMDLDDADRADWTRRRKAEFLRGAVAGNLLRPTAGGFRLDLRYREGELVLNGRPTDPSTFAIAGLLGGR